jgi:hypothetical protein
MGEWMGGIAVEKLKWLKRLEWLKWLKGLK